MIEEQKLKQIIEGALLAAGKPLPLDRMEALFNENERPEKEALEQALEAIEADCQQRGFELKKVASGYRFQVRQEFSEWIGRLWEEKPQRYSRALMETLSIIAYRQPITRGDIEKIRGVAVSTQIVQTLLEHEWVRIVGYRDVPGRPAMYATTRQFLDYFNLGSLQELPPLSEIRDLEEINRELSLDDEKPAGRIIEFPEPEAENEIAEDEEEAAAAAIGTRPISEILDLVDSKLGLAPELELSADDEVQDAESDETGSAARADDARDPVDAVQSTTADPSDEEAGGDDEAKPAPEIQ